MQRLCFVHCRPRSTLVFWFKTPLSSHSAAVSARLMPSWEELFGVVGRISELHVSAEEKKKVGVRNSVVLRMALWPECRERKSKLLTWREGRVSVAQPG